MIMEWRPLMGTVCQILYDQKYDLVEGINQGGIFLQTPWPMVGLKIQGR